MNRLITPRYARFAPQYSRADYKTSFWFNQINHIHCDLWILSPIMFMGIRKHDKEKNNWQIILEIILGVLVLSLHTLPSLPRKCAAKTSPKFQIIASEYI